MPPERNKKSKNTKENALKKIKRKTTAATRFNVDDPVNDLHDDEIFGDEVIIPKENNTENETFEKPW
ncbi:MAG: hypothetical protein WC635_17175 [Bacteriovorax sp.]